MSTETTRNIQQRILVRQDNPGDATVRHQEDDLTRRDEHIIAELAGVFEGLNLPIRHVLALCQRFQEEILQQQYQPDAYDAGKLDTEITEMFSERDRQEAKRSPFPVLSRSRPAIG